MLELDSVQIKIDGKEIIEDISFSLERGHIGCILGDSGCGKTTVLLAIVGFRRIKKGRIILEGNKVVSSPSHTDPPETRKVGMMFQELSLFPHLTAYQNIAFGIGGMKTNKRNAKIGFLLEAIGLKDYAKAYPHELSGGQKQRVALARSLAPSPSLLLMDEPFSSIDEGKKTSLMVDVKDILHNQSITTLLVTHESKEAFFLADVLGIMGKGRMLQWGEADHIYCNPVCLHTARSVGPVSILNGTMLPNNEVRTILGDLTVKNHSNTNYHNGRRTPLNRNLSLHCTTFSVGQAVKVILRPEDIACTDGEVEGVIERKVFTGPSFLYDLRLQNGERAKLLASKEHQHSFGDTVRLKCIAKHIIAISPENT